MKKEVNNFFSHNIAFIRMLKRQSLDAFSDELQYRLGAISAWEKGKASPPLNVFMFICKQFKITPNELLFKNLETGEWAKGMEWIKNMGPPYNNGKELSNITPTDEKAEVIRKLAKIIGEEQKRHIESEVVRKLTEVLNSVD